MKAKRDRIPVAILDLAVLLVNLWEGQQDDLYGDLDSDNDLKALSKALSYRRYNVRLDAVESALAYCNYRNERGDFWHPTNKTLTSFIEDLRLSMDRQYNIVRKK